MLISIEELSTLIGVKVPTLRKWTKPGKELIPCYRIGKLVRFNPEEVTAWLKTKAVVPTEEGVYRAAKI
jgi:excisionase family DNA binding protein